MTHAHPVSLEVQAFKDKGLNSPEETDSVALTLMNATMDEMEVVLRIPDASTLKVLTIAESAIKVTLAIKQLAVIVGPGSVLMAHSVTTIQNVYDLLASITTFVRYAANLSL